MKRMFSQYPDVVSINDLMAMLKIGRDTAYNLLRMGIIKNIKIGRQYRIPKCYIIEYLTAFDKA